MVWCPYKSCEKPLRGGFLQCPFCRRPFDYSDVPVLPEAPIAAGEDPVLARLRRERAERDADRARATLADVDLTAARIVRDVVGVDNTERDERKRQKL